MAKILVVDDEPDLESLIRQKFRKEIRQKEYEFLFAEHGIDALEKLAKTNDVDIVLTDINMPQMDGLTLLTELKEKNPLLKSVIVSAYSDMENIRTAMNRGAFDFVTKPIHFEDLVITVKKALAHALNVKKTLKAIKENNILKMYVDESVLNFMDTPEYETRITANETIEGTVVFIDVCDFTAISETSEPDVVVNLINSYFDIIAKEVIEQEGIIDKFIGDAVMAVFKGEFHLDRAIDTALAVRQKLNEMNIAEDSLKPKVTIGLKSGEMVSGNMGSASLRRLDYTVIGDTVNIAARLQDIAKPNQIIVEKSCYEKVRASFQCKSLGEVKLKNKALPVKIYEVIA